MNFSKYTHIIWDWNGTLFNDTELIVEAVNHTCRRLNLREISVEEYREKLIFPIQDFYTTLGVDFNKYPYQTVWQTFYEAYDSQKYDCRLHLGAEELLGRFRSAGLRQFILTAYSQEGINAALQQYQIAHFFERALGASDDEGAGKVDLGWQLLESERIPKEKTLLIGDTVHDFEVAQALKIDCVLIPCGQNSKARLEKCAAPIFQTLQDLLEACETSSETKNLTPTL